MTCDYATNLSMGTNGVSGINNRLKITDSSNDVLD
jgi:hypothetical protein